MPLIFFILNVLWFITGGVIAGLAWILAGVIMAITIIGLPWARANPIFTESELGFPNQL
jgi:uncharacterized membrane protein YccF (DUF307 family)